MVEYETISEIGLMSQGQLQSQMLWSMSCKLTQVLWQIYLVSAAGFTKPECWLFDTRSNGGLSQWVTLWLLEITTLRLTRHGELMVHAYCGATCISIHVMWRDIWYDEI